MLRRKRVLGTDDRPEPPSGARNLVLVVLDSLRYDTCLEAAPGSMSRLGEIEQRFSYASWTAPSHYNMLMGLLPHANRPRVFASEQYKEEFVRYNDRLGTDGIEFRRLLPSIYLPTFLRNELGYTTHAMTSMPVLNEHTAINRDFDTFRSMPTHNDMSAMVDAMTFGDRPSFWLLNAGETHYPYALPGEDPAEWPRMSGAHGVLATLDPSDEPATAGERDFFDESELASLRERQVRAMRHVDGVLAQLYDTVPQDTWIVVTSDHGELFGEDGYFGHGPIVHEKVFEVPFVEGMRP